MTDYEPAELEIILFSNDVLVASDTDTEWQ